MRRTTTVLGTLALASALTLAGCSSDADSAGSSTDSSTAAATAESTSETTTAVDCSTVTIDSDSDALPEVSGDEPSLTWSGDAEPENLTVKILEEGDGAEVAETDTLLVNYAGWQWDSDEVFDSSWAAGSAVSFGLDSVIDGWRCGLAGTHVGDRVEISIPAEYAYGTDESSGAPTGTLVFVVDIEKAFADEDLVSGTADATPTDALEELAERGVTIEGDLGEAATAVIADGAEEPTDLEVYVIAEGDGVELTAESTILSYLSSTSWDNSTVASAWEDGAVQTFALANMGFDDLVGVPTGSRVVLLFPAVVDEDDESNSSPAEAYVLDIEDSY